ncbi:hypothetical protein N9S81_00475 [bacterium]|nr:hypothetical protein [bacterium]
MYFCSHPAGHSRNGLFFERESPTKFGNYLARCRFFIFCVAETKKSTIFSKIRHLKTTEKTSVW